MSIRRWGGYSTNPGVSYIPEILKSLDLLVKPAGGAVIQAGSGGVVPGSFLYQITAAGASQYYWLPAKLAKVDTSLGTPSTTVFFVRNMVFAPGDAITIGANSGTVSAVNQATGQVTMSAALSGAPANGDRVFSQTAAQNAIKAIALDYAPPLTDSDQAIEVSIAGVFKKDIMDSLYAAADITTWGAVAIPEVNAYRWS